VVAICGGISHSLALIGGPGDVTPRLAMPVIANHQFIMKLPTIEGATYVLEFKHSLADAEWTPLPPIRGYGYGVMRTLADPDTTAPQRFYRVRISPR
jgi:hypothetical protein